MVSGAAQLERIVRGLCGCYFVLVGLPLELLGLEIVLVCLVDPARTFERRLIEVAEATVFAFLFVKLNGPFLLHCLMDIRL